MSAPSSDTILILGDGNEPQVAAIRHRLPGATIVTGATAQHFASAAPNASVLFYWSGGLPLIREVFRMAPRLRWVHSRNVGVEKTIFPELIESDVPFTNGIGVFSSALGEFVLGAILYFAKDFRRMIRNQMAGRWEEFDVLRIAGKTVGIVGYGDIGRATASRLRPMGMNILALKRHLPKPGEADVLVDQFYTVEQRREMIVRCDYVVAAAPLTPETRGLIGEAEIASMKTGAVLINVGRGPVIDEPALMRALAANRIKGAALDVFDEEPLPSGHAFYKLENVLLSPHCADHTPDWLDQAADLFVEQYERFRKGEPLRNVVNKKLGY